MILFVWYKPRFYCISLKYIVLYNIVVLTRIHDCKGLLLRIRFAHERIELLGSFTRVYVWYSLIQWKYTFIVDVNLLLWKPITYAILYICTWIIQWKCICNNNESFSTHLAYLTHLLQLVVIILWRKRNLTVLTF